MHMIGVLNAHFPEHCTSWFEFGGQNLRKMRRPGGFRAAGPGRSQPGLPTWNHGTEAPATALDVQPAF